MATIKLVPRTMPVNMIDAGDKVLAALNKAVELTQLDITAGQGPVGCMLIFWREYDDGTAEESWISSGLNQIEAVGVLHKTLYDIQTFSLEGVPNEEDEGA